MKKSLSLLLSLLMIISTLSALPLSAHALTWWEYNHGSNQPVIDEHLKYNNPDYNSSYENGILYFSRPYGYPAGKKDEAKDTTSVDLSIDYAGNTARDGNYSYTFKNVPTPKEYNNPLNVGAVMDANKFPSGTYTYVAKDPVTQEYWNGSDSSWYRTHYYCTRSRSGSFFYESPHQRLNKPTYLRWDGNVCKWQPVENADGYYVALYLENGNLRRSINTSETEWDFTDGSITIQDGYYFTVVAYSDGDYLDSLPATSADKMSYTLTYHKNGGEGSDTLTTTGLSGKYVLPTTSKGFIAPSGKEFVGWSLTADGSQMVTSVDMNENKDVYAIWRTVGGKIGSNVSYYLNTSTGELSIFGSGDMYNYTEGTPNPSPFANNTQIKTVRIAAGVTSIGDYMFYRCTNLKHVYLENALNLTKLGHGAFLNCTSLEDIYYPNDLSMNISMIDSSVFKNCYSLKEFRIPDGVNYIVATAFQNCSSLKTVTIPADVKSIHEDAFNGCTALQHIFYGGSQEDWNGITIKQNNTALNNATLHTYSRGYPVGTNAYYIADVFGQTGTIVGSGPTYDYNGVGGSPLIDIYCSELIVEDGITTIGDNLFYDCADLTTVTLGNNIMTIGDSAFCGCTGLTTVKLPDSVGVLDDYAFSYCDNLENIYVGDGLTYVGYSTFYHCPSLAKVYYNGLRGAFDTIEIAGTSNGDFTGAKFYSIGGDCGTNATFAYEPETATLTVSGTGAMSNFSVSDVNKRTPWYDYRDEIKSVVVSDGITAVGDCAFINSAIESISFPEGLTTLGSSSVMNCPNLTSVVLPDSLTTMKSSAFFKDTGLTEITIPGNVQTIGGTALGQCANLKHVVLIDGIQAIGDYAFMFSSALESIYIPDSVTSIGEYTFNETNDTFTVYASCNNTLIPAIISGTNRKWEKIHSENTTSKVTKKAQPGKNGTTTYTCTVCGQKAKTATIYAPKTFMLSKSAYTYDGKAKKPSVTVKDAKGNKIAASNYTVTYAKGRKAIGSYAVTIKFKGSKYEGSKKVTFKINPKGTSVSKVSSPKKQQLKVTWKKQTKETTGYQIQYSTDKNFKSGNKTVTIKKNKTTSTTISKLKSKNKYYVRIRTYKTVGKTKYYSDWKAYSKSIKVK